MTRPLPRWRWRWQVRALRPAMLLGAACVAGLAGAFGTLGANVGCSTGSDPGTTVAVTPNSAAVGPAPLRRLSDREYLATLQDLFPTLTLGAALPALPADVAVAGFENAAEAQEPSDVLIARFEAIANAYAEAATADTATTIATSGCADWSTGARAAACASAFVSKMGSKLFRRPLAADEQARFLAQFAIWQAAIDFPAAVQLSMSAMLQSPQFLYRAEPVQRSRTIGTTFPVEPYAMASRLSYFLWESAPDDVLLQAAAANALVTDDQLRAQATRMLNDPRARRVMWDFPRQWLGLDQILLDEHTERTPAVDPTWTTSTQLAASSETERFVENTLVGGGTLRDLLVSPKAWLDPETAHLYGVTSTFDSVPDGGPILLPTNERAGLLTRAAFLAGNSHRGATSPPVRGNAIQLRLLCQLPVSPPAGVDLSQPKASPDAGAETNRTLFEIRTSPAACQTCHVGLNGFGFGLETYNAAGEYQATDNGLPVNAAGAITGTDVDGPFTGGIALSQALSKSRVVHDCATSEMVRYALGRAPVDLELPSVDALGQDFMASEGDLRVLMTEVVLSPSFRMERVTEE